MAELIPGETSPRKDVSAEVVVVPALGDVNIESPGIMKLRGSYAADIEISSSTVLESVDIIPEGGAPPPSIVWLNAEEKFKALLGSAKNVGEMTEVIGVALELEMPGGTGRDVLEENRLFIVSLMTRLDTGMAFKFVRESKMDMSEELKVDGTASSDVD